MSLTIKSGMCSGCDGLVEAKLHRKIFANGAYSFPWKCPGCGKLNPFGDSGGLWIAKEKVENRIQPDEIDALPVIMPDLSYRCTRCGERTSELHHWAPRAIFGDGCEGWPKDYLCKKCHDEWHEKVTPQLRGNYA